MAALLVATLFSAGVRAQESDRRADSPAASRVPATVTEQSYEPALVERGQGLFAAQCAFCHGLDAAGGSGGADLTRSELVSLDVRGDRIEAVVRNGSPNADVPMPAFAGMDAGDLAAIVAFIHDRKARAESVEGGRRAVSVADLQTGSANRGRRYFDSNCADCHAVRGDLAGVGARLTGLRLLQTMLYPRPQGPAGATASRATPIVTITTRDGERLRGPLLYQDEFTLATADDTGRYRSFAKRGIEFEIESQLDGHLAILDRLTDADMHDVLAFLQTL